MDKDGHLGVVKRSRQPIEKKASVIVDTSPNNMLDDQILQVVDKGNRTNTSSFT